MRRETASKLIRVKPSTAKLLEKVCRLKGCSFDFALKSLISKREERLTKTLEVAI